MNSARPFGIGIVGNGMIAAFHAKAIAAMEGAVLAASLSRRAEQVEAFAAAHGGRPIPTLPRFWRIPALTQWPSALPAVRTWSRRWRQRRRAST